MILLVKSVVRATKHTRYFRTEADNWSDAVSNVRGAYAFWDRDVYALNVIGSFPGLMQPGEVLEVPSTKKPERIEHDLRKSA